MVTCCLVSLTKLVLTETRTVLSKTLVTSSRHSRNSAIVSQLTRMGAYIPAILATPCWPVWGCFSYLGRTHRVSSVPVFPTQILMLQLQQLYAISQRVRAFLRLFRANPFVRQMYFSLLVRNGSSLPSDELQQP